MDPSGRTTLFTSSVVVTHNAVKNIIFRTAAIILDFVILRLFGLIAFRCSDYTSFLMFAEDLIQKAWFVSSRGITARQSLLVGVFAVIAAAGGFYDTMLWAIDNPGFVIHHKLVNGATLTSQMANNAAYVVMIASNSVQQSEINLNASFEINLYNQGFNFTLPGVFEEGTIEAIPPLFPLRPAFETPRIWLDDEGFAVGVDATVMVTPNMLRNVNTSCIPLNPPNVTDSQVWNCNIHNDDATSILDMNQGLIQVWWDMYHPDVLTSFGDNPWVAFGKDGGTFMMKRVFTVTKGYRRHTFKQVVIKATVLSSVSDTLDDEEIADFMRRTWLTYGPPTTTDIEVQELTDDVLYAKGNNTGRTFGILIQANTSVSSTYTDFFTVGVGIPGNRTSSYLRFTMTNTTLIRSETLAEEITSSSELCPGTVYSEYAAGGVVALSGCTHPSVLSFNQTLPLSQNPFLGLMDTSSMAIFIGFLGDGLSNVSSVALNQTGMDWLPQQDGHIDSRLISRAMLMSGNASAVMVDVGTTVAAISGLQLFLCILPCALAIVIWWFTRDPSMSYFQNSFLAAVLSTTHTTATPSYNELGYIHSMPEISLRRRGKHVTLGVPHERTISTTISTPVDEQEMVYEPLILEQDYISRIA